MPTTQQEIEQSLTSLCDEHDAAQLEVFLTANADYANEIVEFFKCAHKEGDNSRALNFLDSVLLVSFGQYSQFEHALKECGVERILPSDIHISKAVDAAVVDSVTYMLDGNLTALNGRAVHFHYGSKVAAKTYDFNDSATSFFERLAARLDAEVVKSQTVPKIQA